jgi:dephospho-CoA kinase
MHVFGLTGGIGSGKSSVAALWRRRGLPVLDADELARAVVAPGSDALAELARELGADLLRNGQLDRKELARRVFGQPERLRRLEAITHPRIMALRAERLAQLAAAGEPLVCSEIPLLFEKGLEAELRPVVVVSAPPSVQLQRALLRDGATAAELEARIAAQLPLADKVARADYVIDNQGSIDALAAAADRTLTQVCLGLGVALERYGLAGTDGATD